MTSLNHQLWELIKAHKLPNDASGTPFIKQLIDEFKISHETASVAINEYQKFMYLCATRSERNIPSKAVDLVWHLHMQHSRDYWDLFCKKLGKPIHHNPGSKGAEHLNDYKATVAAYKDLFGIPPKGIWKMESRLAQFFNLIVFGVFISIGTVLFLEGEEPIFTTLWLGVSVYLFLTTLYSTTTKGELTLVFERGDPFADNEAGDCSSGDCGGCGD